MLLDRFEVELGQVEQQAELLRRLERSLDLSYLSPALLPDEFEAILSDQLGAASEFVYSHPIWEDIRQGSRVALYAYLLETRHYLAAATARMAPAVGRGVGLTPLTLLLSQHLIEEWDHARFFEEALVVLGCRADLVRSARPLPTTLEWIHVTREIAAGDQLTAAACSGFMEYSSVEVAAVTGWHDMLVAQGLLPAMANRAIFAHVETDLGFGHAENWRRAIAAHGPVTTTHAARALNGVTTIAEAIYRWLSSLRSGLAGDVVLAMQAMGHAMTDVDVAEPDRYEVAIYGQDAVWPATLLDAVTHGIGRATPTAGAVAGLTYALAGTGSVGLSGRLGSVTTDLGRQLAPPAPPPASDPEALGAITASWLRAIDGHRLWERLATAPDITLATGYLLENYHYLASAAKHIGAALASCPSGTLRVHLVDHFDDELEHCRLLQRALATTGRVPDASQMRPLPSTVAFIGGLTDIAMRDWKAYLLVSAFLQASLSTCRPEDRHGRFYRQVAAACPDAGELLAHLWRHDDLDAELGHDDRPAQRLAALCRDFSVPPDAIQRASLVPSLAWSFLDGIAEHYGAGASAIVQRVGWRG